VRWDKNSYGIEWFDLVGLDADLLMTEHIHSQDIVPGNEYQF